MQETYETTSTEIVEDRPAAPHGVAAEPPVGTPRFSLGATFLGWACASFVSLVLLAIVVGALGTTAANDQYYGDGLSNGDMNALGTVGFVGFVVATFIAYFVGGYAAGRISLWRGTTHGVATAAWLLLAGIVLYVGGTYLNTVASGYVNVVLPYTAGQLTTAGLVWALLTLVAAALGGALGGRLGERYHDEGRVGLRERRRIERGRPL